MDSTTEWHCKRCAAVSTGVPGVPRAAPSCGITHPSLPRLAPPPHSMAAPLLHTDDTSDPLVSHFEVLKKTGS